MANVFGILTALVLALSAFIAYKNKAKFAEKVDETATQKAVLTKDQNSLADLKTELAALPAQIKEVEVDIEKLTGTESALKKSNASLKESTTAEETKVAANKEKLTTVRSKIESSGDLDALAAKLRTTATDLEDLGQKISASEAQFANIESQVNSTEVRLEAAKAKFASFSSNESAATLKTRIRAIYPNWGFVTLASGNNAGVVTSSRLNVVRGSDTIAKLIVTAVESNTSSASIDPTSLGSDVTLQVGDRVEAEVKVVAVKPVAPETTPAVDPAAVVPATETPADTTAPAEVDPFSN